MGGKSGGGQSTPYEAPNTLNSAQALRIIDAISEGVVDGFANGNDAPFKSVFFDDTPVQNADGSFNFKGVVGFFQRGTPDQNYVPGFDVSERTVSVSARVRKETPIVRAVTDNLVSRVRVTVGVERNSHTKDNGDTVAANTTMLVELVNANGVATARTVAFTEKGSGAYYQDVLIDDLPEVPFNIRVSRVTADSTSDRISNNTFFASYVEIVDAKLSYPHTAVASLAIDSDQFGSSLPRRNYLLKGRLVKVPSDYDPVARTYGKDAWDGSFKTAWTNNPALIYYDVLTQPRFSTLARRLGVADIDKWSLYQIARYCDELVDDGFGGKEPRFVCNAYITDSRQAGEFLLDLASVFTGLPMWNGNQVSVVMDADSDPVALYNNSNVKDGLFSYGGAAYKAIHTAVEVQYLDKYDGYRSKIELVKDDAAIKRYGLNPKRITAFGCDSRGQAARFGAWVLQTELRQQHTVSFTVGREGLRHLPYDVVTVMDNSYAGADLSGRVAAVNGAVVTLDRDVADVGGALFYYSNSDGLQSVKVLARPAANQLRLASVAGLAESAGWAISGKVQARQYRAIGIKENTDEGTYTITALLHDPAKYAAVDTWASFDKKITTLHTLTPTLLNGEVSTDGNTVVITWDNLTASGQVLTYDIKIYRNNQLYRHTPAATSAEIRLENLPNGDYRAEIRGRNARGVLSEPLIKAWTIDYTITGLRAKPQIFAINLVWTLPQTVVNTLHTEIWYAAENKLEKAAKLAALPYPQNDYTLTGVNISDQFYFWVRIIDAAGNTGGFTASVLGVPDNDPAPIVAQIQGAITKSALSQSLLEQLNSDMTETAADAVAGVDGKVRAMYSLKVEAISGGRKAVAGLALGADGATGDSQVLIYADKFGLVNPSSKAIDIPFTVTNKAGGSAQMALKGDFIATDSILARHIKASQLITTPILSAPTINAGQINSTSINNGNGNFTVDAAGNLYAKSGTFEGTVRAEKIVGNVLKSFRLKRVSTGVYTLAVPAIEYDSVVTVNIPMFVDGGISASGNVGEIQARWSYIEVSINGVEVFLPAVNGIGWSTPRDQFPDYYKHYPDTYQRLQWSEVVPKGKTVTVSISIKNFANRAQFRNAAATPTVDISPLGN